MNAKENALIAYNHGIPLWVPSRISDMNIVFPAADIERYQGENIGKDGFGVEWIYEPLAGAPMVTDQHILTDIRQWREKVRFPDLESVDWIRQAKHDQKNFLPDRLNMAMSINGPFERMHSLLGMVDTLCSLLEEPEECGALAEAITDHKIRMINKVSQYYDIDVFNMNDDYGMNGRMFMSADTWRNIFKPQLKRIVDACHENGLLYEHHSCGYIEPIVEDLVEIGIDALDVWQVCNVNMRTLKNKFQDRLTFCGGFDNQGVFDRQGVTFQECYDETVRAIQLMAPGGSYVAFTISITTSFHDAFVKALEDVGQTIYKNRRFL